MYNQTIYLHPWGPARNIYKYLYHYMSNLWIYLLTLFISMLAEVEGLWDFTSQDRGAQEVGRNKVKMRHLGSVECYSDSNRGPGFKTN
jgi:hypothetical protein